MRREDKCRVGLPGSEDVQVVVNCVGERATRNLQDDLALVFAIGQGMPVVQPRWPGEVQRAGADWWSRRGRCCR